MYVCMDICIDVYMQRSVDYFSPGSHALLLPTYRIPILPSIAPSLTLAIQMNGLPHFSIFPSISLPPSPPSPSLPSWLPPTLRPSCPPSLLPYAGSFSPKGYLVKALLLHAGTAMAAYLGFPPVGRINLKVLTNMHCYLNSNLLKLSKFPSQ